MGKRNLKKLKKALLSFLHLFEVSAEGTHVGMISFNNDADLLFGFKDDRYHTEDQLRNRIEEIPLRLELQTRTDLALTLAKNKLFSLEGGDRPDVPNVCIVFTDGKSTGKPRSKGFVPIPETVEFLTGVGIHPFIQSTSPLASHLFIRSSIHLFIQSYIHPLISLSLHPFIHLSLH